MEPMYRPRLLTPGPVELHPKALEALSRPQLHHRSDAAKQVFLQAKAGLEAAFQTQGQVLLLTGSGTAAMDALVQNLFAPGERVLVPVHGNFSERWAKIATEAGLEVLRLELPWGQVVRPEHLESAVGPFAGLLLTLSRWLLEILLWLLGAAAALPGVAVRWPEPSLVQILAYLAMLSGIWLTGSRLRRWLLVAGGLLVLTGSCAWSALQVWQRDYLEMVATAGSRELALVATYPGGRVMVIQAGIPRPVAQPGAVDRRLVGYLHGQQLLRLDYLAALSITAQNAPTLLALVQEFEVAEFWSGGERPPLAAYWELRNYLGDHRKRVRNLALEPLATAVGGVQIASRQLPGNIPGRSAGPVILQLTYQGQQVLIVPPGSADWRARCLAAGLPPSQVLILPAANLKADFLPDCLRQVAPRFLILTGSKAALPPAALTGSWQGAVSAADRQNITVTIRPGDIQVRP